MPTFRKDVTTFTRNTRLESGRNSPTGSLWESKHFKAFTTLCSFFASTLPILPFLLLSWLDVQVHWMILFLVETSSRQAEQKSFPAGTTNWPPGYCHTRSSGLTPFGSPDVSSLQHFAPVVGRMGTMDFALVGQLRRSWWMENMHNEGSGTWESESEISSKDPPMSSSVTLVSSTLISSEELEQLLHLSQKPCYYSCSDIAHSDLLIRTQQIQCPVLF